MYISSIHFGFILQEIGKRELINGPFIMTPVLSDNKALDLDKLIITTSKVGKYGIRNCLIECEGSIG